MTDNPDQSREKMTPAQRRLVEDGIEVYPPEEAEAMIKKSKVEYARKMQQMEKRRQIKAARDKANPSEGR